MQVVLSLVVCAASAGVIHSHHGVHGAHYGGASEQHHSQDEAGNYVYGYSDPNSHKEESGVAGYHGEAVKGSYSYVAPDGSVIHNDYYADENGFRSSLAPTAAHDVHPQPDYSHHAGHGVHHGVAHHGVAHHGVAHHGHHGVLHHGHYAVSHHGVAHHGVSHHGVAHHGVFHHGVAHHGVHHAAPYHNGAFSYGVSSSHPAYTSYHH